MKQTVPIVPINNIGAFICTIRGVHVMLDSDLAEIYGVETKAFNQAVKRNIQRFPEAFRFQLTADENESLRRQSSAKPGKDLRSQSVTSSGHGGSRYLPYAFTEQGVAMLSAVLRSETAIKVSIQIINAFVEMRRFIQNNASIFTRLESVERRQLLLETKSAETFDKVFRALEAAEPPKQGIFYDGQVYDAHAFASDLIRKARRSLVLVDNYVDDTYRAGQQEHHRSHAP
jgi:hypothetical protein